MTYSPATLLLFAALLILPSRATAEQDPASEKATPITRRFALRTAAQGNLDVLAERLARDAAAHKALAARRPFIPSLVLTSSYDDTYPASAGSPPDTDTPDRSRTASYGGGVEWQAPIGTSVGLTVSDSRAITGTGQNAPSIDLAATQPLLKDGWRNGVASDMRQADAEASIQRESFRSYLNDFLAEVDAAYWELAFSQADIEIKKRSLERAKSQYDDTKENIRRGLLPETDIYVVEENVVSFEQQLLSANQRLALSESRLAALLQQEPGSLYVATDSLDDCEPALPDLAEATRIALADHPALAARRLALEKANIQLAYARNHALPALDLSASFSLNGVSGSASEAWSEVATADKPAFGVGLKFSIPLWLGPDLADVKSSQAETRRQLLNLKLEESRLAFAVKDALTQLSTQKRQLALARRIFELAEKKLEAETDKYKNGVSKLPEVVRFQRELDAALIAFRAAQKELLVNYARLRRTEGQLDRDAGLEVR